MRLKDKLHEYFKVLLDRTNGFPTDPKIVLAFAIVYLAECVLGGLLEIARMIGYIRK